MHEVVSDCLAGIEAQNPRLNAFLTVNREAALRAARGAQAALDAGSRAPLLGVPIGVKDVEDTADMVTTYGSSQFAGHRPAADSLVVDRLRRAGAVIVGKTNTPAFALLGETHNDLRGDCRNPADRSLTSGGSSGGSAAAVAAGLVPAATGSDYGGSVPAPAGLCGVVGFKPSPGLIPIVPRLVGSALFDAVGVLTNDVTDAALLLTALAGHDARDPASLRAEPVEFCAGLDEPPRDVNVGWSADLGRYPVDPEVARLTRDAVSRLTDLGWRVRELAAPVDDPWQVFAPLSAVDLRLVIDQMLGGSTAALDPETVDELAAVTPLSAEQYVCAYDRMLRFRAHAAQYFDTVDVIATPTTAVAAFPIRRPPHQIDGRQVRAGWPSFMPFQVPWNVAGAPVISLPVAATSDGRPVGLQLVARPRGDRTLLRIAAAAHRLFDQ